MSILALDHIHGQRERELTLRQQTQPPPRVHPTQGAPQPTERRIHSRRLRPRPRLHRPPDLALPHLRRLRPPAQDPRLRLRPADRRPAYRPQLPAHSPGHPPLLPAAILDSRLRRESTSRHDDDRGPATVLPLRLPQAPAAGERRQLRRGRDPGARGGRHGRAAGPRGHQDRRYGAAPPGPGCCSCGGATATTADTASVLRLGCWGTLVPLRADACAQDRVLCLRRGEHGAALAGDDAERELGLCCLLWGPERAG